MGVQTQPSEIRISLGGSALFAVYLLCLWGFEARQMFQSMGNKTKERLLLLAMMLALLLPMNAQPDEPHGLFGRGGNRDDISVSGGVMNQGFGATQGGFINQGFGATDGNVTNQGFGATHGGITNQTFGTPLGSGLFVLLAAGVGYATLKTKRRKSNRLKRN